MQWTKLFLSALAPVVLALPLFSASCSQPPIQCVSGHGPYIAKYTLRDGSGSCAALVGEEIGVSTFLLPNADKTLADYDKRRISVQSTTFGELFQEREGLGLDDADVPYALGDYTTDPDEDNLCFAGGLGGKGPLSAAEIDVPDAQTVDDDGNPVMLPARHLRQTFSDLRLFVTAAIPGTRLTGTMTYSDLLEGCTATYDVVGLFPAVPCKDAMGKPDDEACNPRANPEQGHLVGSGINPDFKVKCDPVLLYCVLDEAPLPSL